METLFPWLYSVFMVYVLDCGRHVSVCVASQSSSSGVYIDNSLQQSVLVERLGAQDRRLIKEEILTLLGLHHKPRPRTHGIHNSAPSYMLDLYNTIQRGEEEAEELEVSFSQDNIGEEEVIGRRLVELNYTLPGMERIAGEADMITSFINHAHHQPGLRHKRNRRYYFDFSEVEPEQAVTGAELRIYKQGPDEVDDYQYRLDVYMVVPGVNQVEGKSWVEETHRIVDGNYEGWIHLNVTHAAWSWDVYPTSNLGLYMSVTDSEGNDIDPSEIGLMGNKGPEDKQPFMVAFFKETEQQRPHRSRRSAPIQVTDPDELAPEEDVENSETEQTRKKKKKRRKNEGRMEVTMSDEPSWGAMMGNQFRGRSCQKRTLYVNFADLGWREWIIAPDGYSAFYCDGECSFPLNVHMNATNHAIVQTLVHLMNPFAVDKPSCAPTKLSAISVLYFDDSSNVILKKYKNMIVKACGCH